MEVAGRVGKERLDKNIISDYNLHKIEKPAFVMYTSN
jgi:hypothetical protein